MTLRRRDAGDDVFAVGRRWGWLCAVPVDVAVAAPPAASPAAPVVFVDDDDDVDAFQRRYHRRVAALAGTGVEVVAVDPLTRF